MIPCCSGPPSPSPSPRVSSVPDGGDDPGAPVAIIGAGPIGLVAAAHLVRRGLTPLILEAGALPATGIRRWSHVPMFSRWGSLLDPVGVELLEQTGWKKPDPDGVPTGGELVERWLEPLANLPDIRKGLYLETRVLAVSRAGMGKLSGGASGVGRGLIPFELEIRTGRGNHASAPERILARAVLDASGTFHCPNPLGPNGRPLPGEEALGRRRVRGRIPDPMGCDREEYAGRRTLVVGGGHSAMHAVLGLGRLARDAPGTRVLWAVRGQGPRYMDNPAEPDPLSLRASLEVHAHRLLSDNTVELISHARFKRVDVRPDGPIILHHFSEDPPLEVDRIVQLTGGRPDLQMLRELRLELDPRLECPRALAPFIDPDVHTCETVRAHGVSDIVHPEPNFFVVGMKSYGRAPGFLLATGYEQIRSVVAHLDGDTEAAAERRITPGIREACSARVE